MYVDKKLSGVKAVQTLSRLNRVHPGKEDTFVLDFANEREVILDSFQPYYEQTGLTESTDPNQLYDLKAKLEATQIVWQSEIDAFCRVFFKSRRNHTRKDHARLNALIDPAVVRYRATEEEAQEDFKHALAVYLRLYSFLSQIMPFQDMELEKFYAYGRLLFTKLPRKGLLEWFRLDDEVALEYYRLQKISEGSITLEGGVDSDLTPITDAGRRKDKDEFAPLSQIIDILNRRFGTDFTEADRLFFSQIEEELVLDETLLKQAKSNDIDNFRFGFEDAFVKRLIERMDQNRDIFARIMDDQEFAGVVKDWMLKRVYERLNE
jgi:type I restriction enzyme R subunit